MSISNAALVCMSWFYDINRLTTTTKTIIEESFSGWHSISRSLSSVRSYSNPRRRWLKWISAWSSCMSQEITDKVSRLATRVLDSIVGINAHSTSTDKTEVFVSADVKCKVSHSTKSQISSRVACWPIKAKSSFYKNEASIGRNRDFSSKSSLRQDQDKFS